METTINERIRELVKLLGVSGSKFASMIGVPQTTISNILTRDTEPGYKILNAISNHIELLSSDWLLLGRGEMFATPYMEQPLESDSRNLSDSVLESTRQNEILSIMQRQMEQNEKMIKQLMRVIDNNNRMIGQLQEEIRSMRNENRNKRIEREAYYANKSVNVMDGFEEV